MTSSIRTPAASGLAGITAMLALFAAPAFAATPNPPPVGCLDNACRQDARPATSLSLTPVPNTNASVGIKWNPGHYAWASGFRLQDKETLNSILSFIDSIANSTEIRGIQVHAYWSALEGNTPGDYAAGFAAVDAILARCAQHGKQLMLALHERQFGGYGTDRTFFFPAYIVNGPQYGISVMRVDGIDRGITTRVWQQATMDRVIALSRAYGARYDKNPNFEMWVTEETSLNTEDDGFSGSAYLAQVERWAAASREAWPNTILRVKTNYVSTASDATFAAFHSRLAGLGIAMGGPDTSPTRIFKSNQIFTGAVGGRDYRGVVPWVSEVQSPSLGGSLGGFTAAQILNAATKGYSHQDLTQQPMNAQYYVWTVQEYQGGAAQKWISGILPFLISTGGSVANKTCPSAYAGKCVSR